MQHGVTRGGQHTSLPMHTDSSHVERQVEPPHTSASGPGAPPRLLWPTPPLAMLLVGYSVHKTPSAMRFCDRTFRGLGDIRRVLVCNHPQVALAHKRRTKGW